MFSRVTVLEWPDTFADALNQVSYGKRVAVRRDGKNIAAIISMEDLRLLERLVREEEDRIDTAAAEAARAESGERISLTEVFWRCREEDR